MILGGFLKLNQGKKDSTTEGGNERSSSRSILRRNGFNTTTIAGCSPMNKFDNNCKKTHVPSGEDRIRYIKLRQINKNYNNSKNVKAAQAGLCPDKIVTGGTFKTQEALNELRGCTKIDGDLIIQNFTTSTIDFSVFNCLKEITGRIQIENNTTLTAISGFAKLTKIDGSILLEVNQKVSILIMNNAALKTINGFGELGSVGGHFNIEDNAKLETINGFGVLKTVDGNFGINSNAILESIPEFTKLETVGEFFQIISNAKLASIPGFGALEIVNGGISIENNAILASIIGFTKLINVGVNFTISTNDELASITGFGILGTVGGVFQIISMPN